MIGKIDEADTAATEEKTDAAADGLIPIEGAGLAAGEETGLGCGLGATLTRDDTAAEEGARLGTLGVMLNTDDTADEGATLGAGLAGRLDGCTLG